MSMFGILGCRRLMITSLPATLLPKPQLTKETRSRMTAEVWVMSQWTLMHVGRLRLMTCLMLVLLSLQRTLLSELSVE